MIELKFQFTNLDEVKCFLDMQMPRSETPHVMMPHPEVSPMRERKPWTQFDLDYLFLHYNNYTAKQLAKSLNRSYPSVTQKLTKMFRKGILTPKTNRPSKAITVET